MLSLFFAKFSLFFAASTAPPAAQNCLPKAGQHSFFLFPHWWQYLKGTIDSLGNCVPDFHFPGDTWAVALAIVDMLLRVAGLVAIISIIIAGLTYITAAGAVEKTASARRRIYNSLVGLGIVIVALGIVAFIGNTLGG
jgi:hypothetical protein